MAEKPHLTMHNGRWVVMWHRKSEWFRWSGNEGAFADACRYLKASDGPVRAALKKAAAA